MGRMVAAPAEGRALDLSSVVNMGLADEVPGDRQGGWTDQGRANDLSPLKPGRLLAQGLAFEVLDPALNKGKASLLLAGPNREYFPRSATVPVPMGATFSRLYLLHATAWTPASDAVVGTITVAYLDGTETVREVRLRRDVGDWWTPVALPNGYPFWQAEGADGAFGLYASGFEFPAKQAREIRFASTGVAVWGVAAVTMHDAELHFRPVPKETIHSGPGWRELPAVPLGIEAGSVFDFSSITEAPAGEHGFLRATPEGHFEFSGRPGKRVRFWGVNITFGANFPDKRQAELLAERLLRSGYNTVRFHHYDAGLLRKGGKSYDIDPEKLDRLEYLFAALKRRGIYINIDLYTIRRFGQDEIPELGKPVWFDFKGLVPLYDSAFDSWKRYANALLLHRNPYTGMTWADDPALIGICPVNEDTLSKIVKFYQLEELYSKVFDAWIQLPENASFRKMERRVAYNRFLVETQMRSDARMHAHLRSIGVKALLTGANWMTYEETNFLRDRYDYTDMHGYWDHPSYTGGQWKLPAKFQQCSATNKLAAFPRAAMASRIFGHPFVVTEFTYCWPNQYRAEGAALSAAYASLQDWDGVYHFNYSDVTGETSYAATMFELASDPIRLVSDRVAALIFRQGWVRPAPTAIAAAVHQECAFSGEREFPWPFSTIGLVTRIGSFTGDQPDSISKTDAGRLGLRAIVTELAGKWTPVSGLPAIQADSGMIDRLVAEKLLSPLNIDLNQGRFLSETGQLELLSEKGQFRLATDYAECFVLPPGGEGTGGFSKLVNGMTSTGVYVVSADFSPLSCSRRLLVLHLTDLVNTGSVFRGDKRELLDESGVLPYLVKKGTARLLLRVSRPETWQAWVVDASGHRQQPARVKVLDGALELELDTAPGSKGVALAYELTPRK
jgi:hypothetical protein